MQTIQFDRHINKLLAEADESGIWIHCGWSMAIPRAKAVAYVKIYNTNENAGFFEQNGKVVLSHGYGKITLTQQEAAAVIDLIKAAYPND